MQSRYWNATGERCGSEDKKSKQKHKRSYLVKEILASIVVGIFFEVYCYAYVNILHTRPLWGIINDHSIVSSTRQCTALVYTTSSPAMTEINMSTSSTKMLQRVNPGGKIPFLRQLIIMISGEEHNFKRRPSSYIDRTTKYNIYSMYEYGAWLYWHF